jgi:hypothetical protein
MDHGWLCGAECKHIACGQQQQKKRPSLSCHFLGLGLGTDSERNALRYIGFCGWPVAARGGGSGGGQLPPGASGRGRQKRVVKKFFDDGTSEGATEA